MSKYRFKTKEEFIRDGLWEEERDTVYGWASNGEMNRYLGKDIDNEYNEKCDEKITIYYNDWYFGSQDYVLKEQQEYFNDLSQHIGRYIRALVDSPHSGIFVKKGDVGKIINRDQADFPNNKGYYCTEALTEDYLGTKYELLPEDYSPEQEIKKPNIEFIPGKWYNFTTVKGKYNLYVKVDFFTNEELYFTDGRYICNKSYDHANSIDIEEIKNPRLVEDLSEIQEYLPEGHPDKITSNEFKKGEYIILTDKFDGYSKDFVSNHIYKQRKDSTYLQPEYDSLDSITNGWVKYTRNNSHNWRYATQEEIDEYERRGKPYDVTELQKKELSMEEIQEECKKRFPIGCTFINTEGIKDILKDDIDTYKILGNNIWAHRGAGCLFSNGKWAELVSLPEENITEIPEYIECTETRESYFIKDNIYKVIDSSSLTSARLVSNIDLCETKAGTQLFCSIEINGKKYWKPSTKEAYEQQKSLTYESVSGCFPIDKNMLIYDEVGQYPLTLSECWKEIPKFTEQEFDIYGPTPDIE